MNKLIKKIATATMALTLIAGVFTGCAETSNNATVATSTGTVAEPTQYTLSADVSLKAQNGTLPESGKIGDIEEENGTLKIVVEETHATGDSFSNVYSPFCVLKVNRVPGTLDIRNTDGEVFENIAT